MHANVDIDAHLQAALFLGMAGGWVFLLLVWFLAWWRMKPVMARWALRLGLFGTIVYFGLLAGYSAFSKEKTLGRGVEKYFCEWDCHLAYSVQGVEEKKSFFGSGTGPVTQEWDVSVRTRFDEKTISPRRPKDAPLSPSPRVVEVVTLDGRVYPPTSIQGTPLTQPLKPGDSYVTQLQFQLPPDVKRPRLLVEQDRGWPDRVAIGSELSAGHKKTYFSLE
jgi:hypothetical protein